MIKRICDRCGKEIKQGDAVFYVTLSNIDPDGTHVRQFDITYATNYQDLTNVKNQAYTQMEKIELCAACYGKLRSFIFTEGTETHESAV